MAARHLQRVRAQQEEPNLENELLEEDGDTPPVRTAPFNPFDLLGEDNEGTEPTTAPGAESEAEEEIGAVGTSKIAPSDAKAKSCGKRRKKKKGSKGKEAADGKDAPKAEEEDLDKLLESMNITLQSPAPQGPEASSSGQIYPVLAVEPAKLRPENELRRIFGSRVVDSESREDNPGGQFAGASRRVRRLLARGVLTRATLKPGILITPKDHWPMPNGDLTMELVGKREDGCLTFTYVHSPNYQRNQQLFEEVQTMHDPNQLFQFIWQRAPYHVDALWAGHELYRATGQHEQADDELAKLLYGMEMAWHPQFHPASSNCILLLDTDEHCTCNLPFFKALFRYSQDLSRRGMHVTALECCKFLLGLNADDPTGALFCIDFLALKAQQYTFLQDFVKGYWMYNASFSLAQMPNYVFALALATFLRSGAAQEGKIKGTQAQQPGVTEKDWQQAVNAVLLYPVLVKALLQRLREKDVGKDAQWTSILADPLFEGADDGGSATLAHLVDIYVERSSALWKEPASLEWLKRLCQAAIDQVADTKGNWKVMREALWPASQENTFSHLRISSFSDTGATLPPEELQAMLRGPGPDMRGPAVNVRNPGQLGPVDIDLPAVQRVLFEHVPNADLQADLQLVMDHPDFQEAVDHMRAGDEVEEGRMQALRPMLALLQTLMPWVNMGQAPDYAAEDDAARGAERQHEEQ